MGPQVTDRKLTDSWIRGRFEPNLRIERGSIDTASLTPLSGVGFTITQNAVGDVTLTFDPPFSAPLTIVANAVADVTTQLTVNVRTRTASTVRLRRFDAGVVTDGQIDFIATGPS